MTRNDQHVEAELLAYLDGELSDPARARVEAHVSTCDHCASELERLRALRAGLGLTFGAAMHPVRLPRDADERIRTALRKRVARPRVWHQLWLRRGLVTQSMLVMLALVFGLSFYPALQTPTTPPPAMVETLVLGQERLIPGTQAALRVIVRSSHTALPLAGSEITVLLQVAGRALAVYEGTTRDDGSADVTFTVPETAEGAAQLIVETRTPAGESRIERPITIARSYRLFLTTDKPIYRPGQTLHMRALALDGATLHAVDDGEVEIVLLDPENAVLHQDRAVLSDFGTAVLDLDLDDPLESGAYTVRATLGDTVSERTVTVGSYRLPDFRVDIETKRAFYQPGERVAGTLTAEYFYGRPVAGAAVRMCGRMCGRIHGDAGPSQAAEITGETDAEGRFTFSFNLPTAFGAGATDAPVFFELEAEVTDAAGRMEGILTPLPVAAQPIIIQAIPEGGELKPGVENVLFLLTSTPDGHPAETNLLVIVVNTEYVLRTDSFGLAELRFTPQATNDIHIAATSADGSTGETRLTLTGKEAPQLLLRAEQAIATVGDTLRLEVLTAGLPQSTIYLDVVRAGQTVALLSETGGDEQSTVFALDLETTMIGALELHAYAFLPDGERIEDTRLVVVDPAAQVVVTISADQDQYRPGDAAHLNVQTNLGASGDSVQAVLGIGVVDASVYAVETLPPSFARAYLLMDRAVFDGAAGQPGVDLSTISASQDTAARAAWANLKGTPLATGSAITEREPLPAVAPGLVRIAALILVLLPLATALSVFSGLGPAGFRRRALKRLGVGFAVLTLGSPLLAILLGGVMWLLWLIISVWAVLFLGMVIALLWTGLVILGWRHNDSRLQVATGLLLVYAIVAMWLVLTAAQGSGPGVGLIALIAAAYLLLITAWVLLGQGLVLEGRRAGGWLATSLGLLLIPLAICLPFVPGAASDLTRAVGSPALYAGPVGWLSCCAPAAVQAPEAAEPAAEAAAEEEPAASEASAAAPTGAPSPTALPTPTSAAPGQLPAEPWPIRLLFPETLYWAPDARTDAQGHLVLDLPLADTVTTWRLTALASTRDGAIGAATADLVVFQDFFIDAELPTTLQVGTPVTVTVALHSYLPEAQLVDLVPQPARWYTLIESPARFALDPESLTRATIVLRPEQAGPFTLQIDAVGERMSDTVAFEVQVQEEP